MIRGIYNRKGYQVSYGRNYRYVSDFAFFQNRKYYKFIKSVKNILAYAWILLEQADEEKYKILVKSCEEQKQKNEEVNMIYIILHYMYMEKINKDMEFNIDSTIVKKYGEQAKAFILDIEANLYGYRNVDDNNMIISEDVDDYLQKWKNKNEINKKNVKRKKKRKH